ncbi:hypothetical protein BurMR1_0606 [Burkholderia sp. MR1]|nr:hypothetical protein BurMR1_0606 [Burkholderia sp. MR1]
MNLPPLFWRDLTDVLGLLVATSSADFASSEWRYQADKIEPLIQRVRGLLQGSQGDQWNAITRAQVQLILGNALNTYGFQSGKSEPLHEAVAAYGAALKVYSREKMPLVSRGGVIEPGMGGVMESAETG